MLKCENISSFLGDIDSCVYLYCHDVDKVVVGSLANWRKIKETIDVRITRRETVSLQYV